MNGCRRLAGCSKSSRGAALRRQWGLVVPDGARLLVSTPQGWSMTLHSQGREKSSFSQSSGAGQRLRGMLLCSFRQDEE